MRRFRLRLKVLCALILGVLCFTLFIHYVLVGGSSRSHPEIKNSFDAEKQSSLAVPPTQEDSYEGKPSYILDNEELASYERKPFEFSEQCPALPLSSPLVDIQMGRAYVEDIKFENIPGGKWTQGWNIVLDVSKVEDPDNKLKVFVVPHSHNDPGWKRTFETYYVQLTKGILDSMVKKLSENEKRKFIWAEMSYLSLWWKDITEETKEKVRQLVKNGQLEIVTGGWVMTDEANSHFYSMIQQLTHGQQWLLSNIGVKPRHSWCIDPFGMSPTMPLLLKRSGLEALLGQRSHYEVKKYLALNKNLEFRWRQLWDGNGKTDLLTHMMPFYSYDVPHTCGPDPSVCCQFDFKRLPQFRKTCPWGVQPQLITEQNVAHRAEMLLDQWRKKAELYSTNVLLVPLGDDFRYENEAEWDSQMSNYEKLFKYMNKHAALNVDAQFGTLADYFDELKKAKDEKSFPSLSGDFFTYADKDDNYWSGYYTSRPFYKRMDRELSSYLRAADILFTLAWRQNDLAKDWLLHSSGALAKLYEARSSLSLFQHHDGVTGTAKDHVVQDYALKMFNAIKSLQQVMQLSVVTLLNPNQVPSVSSIDNLPASKIQLENVRKISNEDLIRLIETDTEKCQHKVVLFNSLSWERKELIDFRVSTSQVEVSLDGMTVASQIVPLCWTQTGVHSCHRLFFLAKLLPFQTQTYCLSYSPNKTNTLSETKLYNSQLYTHSVYKDEFSSYVTKSSLKSFNLQNNKFSVSFNDRGFMKSITTKSNKQTTPVNVNFAVYNSRQGREMSGAYLFLPSGEAKVVAAENPIVFVVKGALLSMVVVDISHVTHCVLISHVTEGDDLGIDIQNLVDVRQTANYELAMRLSTNINSKGYFFTDLNGFQMIRRKYLEKVPLQGNFYPMPAAAYVEDTQLRLTLLSAQSLGVSSLKSGELEVIQDRRLNQDDERGLGQGVQDNRPTLTMFRLVLEIKQTDCRNDLDGTHPSGFLTAQTHLALESLTHPIYPVMMADTSTHLNLSTYTPVESGPGLDIHVVSLSTLHVKGEPHSAGLVLRKLKFDDCYDVPRYRSFSGDEVSLSLVLPLNGDDVLYKSSLTFLDIDKNPLSKSVSVCSMDIATFYLTSSSNR